ncbi:two-component system response regulator [Pedobacter sp. PACM 27299]|uniref:sigma-54-dependent transcriptional regulator n=1 Tax=Pedobacter sp. PACM 27299 TaxID=1727164 RepID=UPI0007064ED3|nr:sigma-54 dependent transcriptional regulator [Pedobacter sp. PACM 27299]ALL08570.1 two-component system response regulator [Pedobacter sp. PACM 27299]
MILIIDDDIAVRTSLMLLLEQRAYPVKSAANAAEGIAVLKNEGISLVILDLNFSIDTSGKEGMALLREIRALQPLLPVVLITGWASIDLAVQGMKLGANDFINKPWNNEHLLQSIKTLISLKDQEAQHQVQSHPISRKRLDKDYDFQSIVAADQQMLELLEIAGRVAETDASVLITGESGTGKELIAEALHQNSLRKNRAFIKVNLGGISTSLFESEMFGHVRGAFTDARNDRIGRFEMANKGTIFLDEIGDLDASSQVKLLRVLQDRSYEVLGSSRTKMVDVRVICATNKNLAEMVQKGTFREDLLYRINLITLKLPPLRDRAKDIPLLLTFMMDKLRQLYNRPDLQVSPVAIKWLQKLPLPGNIRQLKNMVERSVLVSRTNLLEIADFSSQLEQPPIVQVSKLPDVGAMTLEETEILMIKRALAFHQNRISKAALALGITRSALYRRLEKFNIPYDERNSNDETSD